MTAIDETLRSTVGRDAAVPRKRRVSDMGAEYSRAAMRPVAGRGRARSLRARPPLSPIPWGIVSTARERMTMAAAPDDRTPPQRVNPDDRVDLYPAQMPAQHQEEPGL